jgi:hypothetical protein
MVVEWPRRRNLRHDTKLLPSIGVGGVSEPHCDGGVEGFPSGNGYLQGLATWVYVQYGNDRLYLGTGIRRLGATPLNRSRVHRANLAPERAPLCIKYVCVWIHRLLRIYYVSSPGMVISRKIVCNIPVRRLSHCKVLAFCQIHISGQAQVMWHGQSKAPWMLSRECRPPRCRCT